jgi:TRAP-type C4-dicarboxylate transport system permease small subunit
MQGSSVPIFRVTKKMLRIEKTIITTAQKINWVAAVAILAMMLLTTLDVALRLFKSSIPGTYEIIGLLGALVTSFALGYTSVEKGHIAVDFLITRFSPATQALISAVNAVFATGLFTLITWQSVIHGIKLMERGEVSLTIEIPIYPFVFGIAAGSGLLCLVLVVECARSIRSFLDHLEP